VLANRSAQRGHSSDDCEIASAYNPSLILTLVDPSGARMRRREFIGSLIGTAVAWPLAASAQQPAMPVIGCLNSSSPASSTYDVRGFHKGLSETGYVEGQNVAMEYRWAEGQYDRLPAMAVDLVRRQA
jgi:putative ABC transport system substrate-binding protein